MRGLTSLNETNSLNSVRVWGARGGPPPPTTKLAVFYRGGFESQMLFNFAGYAVEHKFELWKQQTQLALKKNGAYDQLDILEFQLYVGQVSSVAASEMANEI